MNILRKSKKCEELTKSYYAPVFRRCLFLLNQDYLGAEDCTQDVFKLLIEKMDTLDLNQNIRGWLYEAAYRICANYLKQESRRRAVIIASLDDVLEVPSKEDFTDRDSVFDVLTEEEMKLLEAYYSEEYGNRSQIAAQYGLSTSQLFQRIYMIRQKLKEELNKRKRK